jgi:N-acetylglucosaminyldiphosphoundecaprenol N-acetyl-beta-D-mannosaminyltransferase
MKKASGNFHFKGIKIDDIDYSGVELLIQQKISSRSNGYFCLTDVGNLMMAQDDPQLAKSINQSTASIADGAPLAWFGKLIGRELIQRVSGVELFQKLVHQCNFSHFLLGDTIEMQQRIIAKARSINPNLRISGYSPPFKSVFSVEDNRKMLDIIRKSSADIIWVSFGGSKQEKWMYHHAAFLEGAVMIGVGAAFKYYTGDLVVPSRRMQGLGLQWMTRLIKNHKRWMTKGPLKYRILFSIIFPFELLRHKNRITKHLALER